MMRAPIRLYILKAVNIVFAFTGAMAFVITRIEQAITNHSKSPDFRTLPSGRTKNL